MKTNPLGIINRTVVPDDGLDNKTILELPKSLQKKILETRCDNSKRESRAKFFRTVLMTVALAIGIIIAACHAEPGHFIAAIAKTFPIRTP